MRRPPAKPPRSAYIVMSALVAVLVGGLLFVDLRHKPAPSASTNSTTTAAPLPTTPVERLQAAVYATVPSVIRYSYTPGGEILVEWKIAENLTGGLTKDNARAETLGLIEAVKNSGVTEYTDLQVLGDYPLTDQYGNAKPATVVQALFDKATIDRINPSGIDIHHLFDLDPAAWVDPAFRY